MTTPLLPARYEGASFLGRGAMGEVVRVHDRHLAQDVALKRLDVAEGTSRDEAVYLFRREFAVMATFDHPNVVHAYDLGALPDGTPYYTMSVAEGAAPGPGEEAAIRRWLPGLLAALAHVHARGHIHGDLKPDNVHVAPDGRPTLLDFGLARPAGQAGGPARGTPAYMAPEVIAGDIVDDRADLYALGAMVYELLGGRLPHDGADALAILRSHREGPPPHLSQLAPMVSNELTSAVMRLLAPSPSARFARADDVLLALGLPPASGGQAGLLASPIVGQRPVREALAAAVAGGGTGGLLWLVGPAGGGKSRLLREASAHAQLGGRTVLAAGGLGIDAVPYAALRPWLVALAERHPDRAAALVRACPAIGLEPLPALEGEAERARLQATAAELATAMGARAVWLLDDIDRLDPASRALIDYMQRQAALAEVPARWIYTTTAEAGEGEAVTLPPLDGPDVAEVAAAMLGVVKAPSTVGHRLAALAAGNPGQVGALLRHWIARGALRREGASWATSADPTEFDPAPGASTLDGLPPMAPAARDLARWAALVAWPTGGVGSLPMLADLAAGSEAHEVAAFAAALAGLEGAGVLAIDGADYRMRVDGAMVIGAWAAGERQAAHDRAAAWLVARTDEAGSLEHDLGLARHGLAGTHPAAAIGSVLTAARRAIAVPAIGAAEALLRQARPVTPPEHIPAVDALWAYVLRYTGRIDEALAVLEAHVLADPPPLGLDLAEELVTAGILHQLKGRYDVAGERIGAGIAQAERDGNVAAGVRGRLYAARVALFTGNAGDAKAYLARALADARAIQKGALLAGVAALYGYVLATSGAEAEGLALLEEAVDLATRAGDVTRLLDACGNTGNVHLAAGRLKEAQTAFVAYLRLCQRVENGSEAIFAHLNLGTVSLSLGDTRVAAEHTAAALTAARRQGRKFPEGFALALEGLVAIRQGRPADGALALASGLALAREIANTYLECNVHVLRAQAAIELGRPALAAEAMELARDLEAKRGQSEHTGALAEVEVAVAVRTGAPDAVARATALVATARAAGEPGAIARALRWLAEGSSGSVAPDPVLEALALAAASGQDYLLAELHMLAGHGCLEAEARSKAAGHFGEAVAIADRCGAALLNALAREAKATLDPAQHGQRLSARREVVAALADMTPEDRTAYLAAPGRQCVAAVAAPAAADADLRGELQAWVGALSAVEDVSGYMVLAAEAFVTLLDAERGFMLRFSGYDVVGKAVFGAADDDAHSLTVAYDAVWQGKAIIVEDVAGDERFAERRSLQALAVRAVAAIPLATDGAPFAVLLADDRRADARFPVARLNAAKQLAALVAPGLMRRERLVALAHAGELAEANQVAALAVLSASNEATALAAVAVAATAAVSCLRAYVLAGPALEVRGAFDELGQALPADAPPPSRGVAGRAFTKNEPQHIRDATEAPRYAHRESVIEMGSRAVHAVPIPGLAGPVGVLVVDGPRTGDAPAASLGALQHLAALVGAYWGRPS